LLHLKKKVETKLNKNNEYRNKMKYKTLTLTCDTAMLTHGYFFFQKNKTKCDSHYLLPLII